jgi:molybdate transport system substrate-binding protein
MLFALYLLPLPGTGAEVRIAVAANFAPILEELAADFTARTGHRVLQSSASTGKHYAQIRNGAAFDLFLAADSERPRLLEQAGLGVPGTRFTYAEGRLVLWVPGARQLDDPRAYLAQAGFRHLAIANPRLAPYGLAAQQVLEHWGLWEPLRARLVRGENVGQAFQYVATGNAEVGLVALSLLRSLPGDTGAHWLVPADLHDPVSQQALLLRRGEAAEAFLDYLVGEAAAAMIEQAGYGLPDRP